MKIGLDNYGIFPLELSLLETVEWADRHGAEGVAFSGLANRTDGPINRSLLSEVKTFCSDHNMYIEWGGGQHFPIDMQTWKPKGIKEMNRVVAEEAAWLDTRLVRSCSGGLMRWKHNSPSTAEFVDIMANELIQLYPILKDLNVIWAIETHFELTSFELLQVFEKAKLVPGEHVGICLDTMNLLTMLEDPLSATKRLLDWIVCTHIKDGGVLGNSSGLVSFPTAFGQGYLPWEELFEVLLSKYPEINLSIEDHNGSFDLPISQQWFRNEFPDLNDCELMQLKQMAADADKNRDQIQKLYFDRDLWPQVCENRMIQNIQQLKKMLNQDD